MAAAAAAAAAVGGDAQTPTYAETRSKHHVPRTPPDHDGNEDGLTEMEDMRLNRLLRSTNSSSSSPAGLPSSSSSPFADKDRPLFASRSSGRDHGTSSPAVHDDESGSHNHSTIASQSRSRSIQGGTVGGDEPPAQHNYPPGGDTLPFGGERVSRELFPPSPEAEAGSSRRNSCFFGGEPSRRQGVGGKGGAGVAVVGRRVDPGREGDDLEDISDGGFHSGCWRRKYVCGEMR